MPSRRRNRGEGTISRRSDGRFMARVEMGVGPKGQRRRKTVYGNTKAEVVSRLREVLKQRDDGTLVAGRVLTVGALLKRWLEATKPGVSYKTHERYAGLCQRHLIPGLGRIRLDRLSPADVETFMASKLDAGLSPRSVHHLRAVLRTALNRAMKWGDIHRNVAALAEPVKVERYDYHVLDPGQARRFLDAVRGDRLEVLYTVALALGLRQGEALGLRWADVNLETGTLAVRHSLQWRKSDPKQPAKAVLVEPKTDRSRRTLVLPAAVQAALHEHRRRQLEDRLLAGSRWEEHGLVFAGINGRPLVSTYVLRVFHEHLKRADLPRMRFHELRHSAASLLIAQGVPLKVVADVLGHSTIALTANTYGHLFEASRREAADAMDRALGAIQRR